MKNIKALVFAFLMLFMFASCSTLETVSYIDTERTPVTVTYVSYYPEWYNGFNAYIYFGYPYMYDFYHYHYIYRPYYSWQWNPYMHWHWHPYHHYNNYWHHHYHPHNHHPQYYAGYNFYNNYSATVRRHPSNTNGSMSGKRPTVNQKPAVRPNNSRPSNQQVRPSNTRPSNQQVRPNNSRPSNQQVRPNNSRPSNTSTRSNGINSGGRGGGRTSGGRR